MKRIFACLLCIALLLCAIPIPAEAAEEWVVIHTAEEWIDLANVKATAVNMDGTITEQDVAWAKNYRLENDLDFSNLSASYAAKQKTIGSYQHPFTGKFDGNGHKLLGLTLSAGESGMFGYIGQTGEVRNLVISGANVLFSDNAAVLAQSNKGLIEHCGVENTNITADVGAVLGGMISRNYGIIRDSYVLGGVLKSNTVYATGHAGFAGSNEEGGVIERCYSTMDVQTKSKYAGGFVGLCYGGTITDCFALGDVSAREHSGGFAGSVVFDNNHFIRCYCANTVTVTGEHGDGFISKRTAESAFQYDLSKEDFTDCYFNREKTAEDNSGALVQGKTESELAALELGDAWQKDNGLPYLAGLPVPKETERSEMTVYLGGARYDKERYEFNVFFTPLTITLSSTGNTRVIDVLDAAVEQGLLTYSYDETTEYGRFINCINGYTVQAPDGWMFTVNDRLSPVSASLQTVQNGDRILWFEGTTENRFTGPTWEELNGATTIAWTDIGTAEELRSMTDLSGNYRLTADIDLGGGEWTPIGTQAAPFCGVFHGQGHTISNFKINGEQNVGFFGALKGATVRNVKIHGAEVHGTENVGILAGLLLAEVQEDAMIAGLIGSCLVEGSADGVRCVGALLGKNQRDVETDSGRLAESTVSRCRAEQVTVTGEEKVGGLIGANEAYVTDSSAEGTVRGTSMVGGLIGDSLGSVWRSHADVETTGDTAVGGFCGSASGTIKECYSLGNVSGREYTGGFVGSSSAVMETAVSAGFVTQNGASSTGYFGGFVGYLRGTLVGVENMITVKNCFGNCLPALAAVGNRSSFKGDTNFAAIAQMELKSGAEIGQKLWELFGVAYLSCDIDGHQEQISGAREATCAEEGYSGDTVCTLCGKVLKQGTTLPMLAHTPVIKDAREATCTEEGNSGNTVCVVCGKVLKQGQILPMLAHTPAPKDAREATCTEEGYSGDTVCTVCGALLQQGSAVPALGHSWSEWSILKAPTAQEEGLRQRICSRCNAEQRETLARLSCDGGAGCPSAVYHDLSVKAWYHEATDFVLQSGLMNGVGNDCFVPQENMTRAMMVTVLWRAAGSPHTARQSPFADVQRGSWYEAAVNWASETGVVNGVSATSFAPNAAITRQELVTMLYRFCGEETEQTLSFKDTAQISSWALAGMQWATSAGVLKGYEDGTVRPQATAKRAELAAMLQRCLNNMKEEIK